MRPGIQKKRGDLGAPTPVKREHSNSPLLVLVLVSLLAGMNATLSAQDDRYGTRRQFDHPAYAFSLPELARRYGVGPALEIYFQHQRQEEERREMELVQEARRREVELRKRIVELLSTSHKLYESLKNPSTIHADAPELAKKCEKLAKAVKKLLK